MNVEVDQVSLSVMRSFDQLAYSLRRVGLEKFEWRIRDGRESGEMRTPVPVEDL
jgi:hypothetical protein